MGEKILDIYDMLRKKWRNTLIGRDYDIRDEYIRKAIDKINLQCRTLWQSLNKEASRSYLWEDLNNTTTSEHLTHEYKRIRDMAIAYSTEGSIYKDDSILLKDIIDALEWMYINRYNENSFFSRNWWPWQIGAPSNLNDIVVLLFEKLTREQIKKYMNAVNTFVPEPYHNRPDRVISVGANRVDIAKVVAIRGLIIKDGNKIEEAKNSLNDVFEYVDYENGFYKDGSFIQHGSIPYNCSYGAVLIDGISTMLNFLSATPWEITNPEVNNIYSWVYDSYRPFIFKGAAMDMVRGRAVSRSFLQDHVIGHDIIESIARLSQFAPEPHSSCFKSMVKGWVSNDYSRSIYDGKNINSILLIKRIMDDKNIVPAGEPIGHFHFANMDRVVHRGKGFAFGLSMYSNRIQNFEYMNSENKRGWHTSDGMTYLYNDDLTHYSDDYWPTVNPYRMPGTTVDTTERQVVKERNGNAGQRKSNKSWVGGTSIAGLYGAAGMELDNEFGTLTCRKSWFMFQNEIVALGTGITSCDNRTIETIVENRKIKPDYNHFILDGKEVNLEAGCQQWIGFTNWAYLGGLSKNTGIGYYFPENCELNVIFERRIGSWADINSNCSEEVVSRNYLTLWIDHGKNSRNHTYSYVILPNKEIEDVKRYSENPDIVILENSPEAQAVKNAKLNILAINFWENNEKTVGEVLCRNKASLMLMESKEELELAVSDPTMENGIIELFINKQDYSLVSKDDEIHISMEETGFRVRVNVENAKGKSFSAVLRK